MKKPLILVGGGGHCKSVIDVAESAGYTILGILDMPEMVGTCVLDYPVLGTDDDIPKENETNGYGKRSNAVPNNYINAYED